MIRDDSALGRLRAWLEDHKPVLEKTASRRAKNAFELGYDAGEMRLRERIAKRAVD